LTRFGQSLGEIWAKNDQILANLIRFGQNQNLHPQEHPISFSFEFIDNFSSRLNYNTSATFPIVYFVIFQPLVVGPITAISHKHESPIKESEVNESEAQHRVVEIDPIKIETVPVNPG